MKKTLVEKARLIKTLKTRNIGEQDIDLALAWVKGELTLTQVAQVKGHAKAEIGTYVFLCRALREYYRGTKV